MRIRCAGALRFGQLSGAPDKPPLICAAVFPSKNRIFRSAHGFFAGAWIAPFRGIPFVLISFIVVVVTITGDMLSLKNHGARLVPTGSVGRSTVDRPTR
jgi:hypothetical protein